MRTQAGFRSWRSTLGSRCDHGGPVLGAQAPTATPRVAVDSDDIGGTVSSTKGRKRALGDRRDAQSADAASQDRGHRRSGHLVPDLPKADYEPVRGCGLRTHRARKPRPARMSSSGSGAQNARTPRRCIHATTGGRCSVRRPAISAPDPWQRHLTGDDEPVSMDRRPVWLLRVSSSRRQGHANSRRPLGRSRPR